MLATKGQAANLQISETQLNTIEEALADLKAGKIIIVVDDEDRENEGDMLCAAEIITPEMINFMATHGRGLICTPLEEKRADELGLPLMVSANSALHETAFTVSIDLMGHGCSTGISAYDRATGIRFMANPEAQPSDFARPGHIFPLRAKMGGVLRRTGHTEAAIDLTRMAGFYPMGVVVEVLNEDGTMARLPQLLEIAKKFDLKIISIDDLVAYRMEKERFVHREFSTKMNTIYGEFEVIAFVDSTSNDTHLVLKKGNWKEDETVTVRVHSFSETGDTLGTLLEDYGTINGKALRIMEKEGKGAFVFLRQSDKGSLLAKLQHFQQLVEEGHPEKFRLQTGMGKKDFGVGAQILRDLGISKMRLLTTHPSRRIGVIGYGLEIVETISLKEKLSKTEIEG